MIYFSNVINTKNTGDKNSSPYLYYRDFFSQFDCRFVNLRDLQKHHIQEKDFVIIGGGGILEHCRIWNENILDAMKHTKNVIFWGCGFNYDCKPKIQIPIEKVLIAGIRDYKHPYINFIPCVSCKSSFFDRIKTKKREIGIIKHYGNNFILHQSFSGIDTVFNSASMQEIIDFINETEIILSDSYHGLYWASISGKKVGKLINNNNSRFKDCIYQYPALNTIDDIQQCTIQQLTGNDLAFFRQLNDLFFEKVKKMIEK